jgi:methyltransferase family protein
LPHGTVPRVPSVEENLQLWGVDHDWPLGGDEWSAKWGSASSQWYGTLLPRIHQFLPARVILEIAPGMGRWTQFLIGHCDRLIGVDVADPCVEACQKRFAALDKASFHVNDGRSFPMVADRSVDLAFSFDSLVHVEADVLASYLGEIGRTLADEGVAFLHHSNYGMYRRSVRFTGPLQPMLRRFPRQFQRAFRLGGVLDGSSLLRARSVDASVFVENCAAAGLRCIGQELITWSGSGPRLIDCISAVVRPGSQWDRPLRVAKNRSFLTEARSIRRYTQVFGFDSQAISSRTGTGSFGR